MVNKFTSNVNENAEENERPAQISVSLRRLSRECRKDILCSHVYHTLWLGVISKEEYFFLLRYHYIIRSHLENLIDSLNGVFVVENKFTGEIKQFSIDKYVGKAYKKSISLKDDLDALSMESANNVEASEKVELLLNYMDRVCEVYSAGLLGILYMFEEAVTYAGPRIANALNSTLNLNGAGTRYLRGDDGQKKKFWQFRKDLDLIEDFQTQTNIVTASNITYHLYRDMLDPRASVRQGKPQLLN